MTETSASNAAALPARRLWIGLSLALGMALGVASTLLAVLLARPLEVSQQGKPAAEAQAPTASESRRPEPAPAPPVSVPVVPVDNRIYLSPFEPPGSEPEALADVDSDEPPPSEELHQRLRREQERRSIAILQQDGTTYLRGRRQQREPSVARQPARRAEPEAGRPSPLGQEPLLVTNHLVEDFRLLREQLRRAQERAQGRQALEPGAPATSETP